MADGIFFDEKQMLDLGWPLNVVRALKRVFESDAATLQSEIDDNSSAITVLQDDKANKIDSATVDNIVTQLSGGDIKDSGIAVSVIAAKADKITSPTNNNLITQDGTGNIQDAGVDISDLVMIVGTGSPEGIVTSNNARQFFDTTGGIQYNNSTVGVNTGWVAI